MPIRRSVTTQICAIDVCLPPFDVYRTHNNILSESWNIWTNAICALHLGGVSDDQECETAKTAAVQPAYWTFDGNCRQARLWISWEAVVSVGPCASLLEQKQGMTTMARLLMPGVAVEELPITPEWLTTYSNDVFPLFLALRKNKINPLVVHTGNRGLEKSQVNADIKKKVR